MGQQTNYMVNLHYWSSIKELFDLLESLGIRSFFAESVVASVIQQKVNLLIANEIIMYDAVTQFLLPEYKIKAHLHEHLTGFNLD